MFRSLTDVQTTKYVACFFIGWVLYNDIIAVHIRVVVHDDRKRSQTNQSRPSIVSETILKRFTIQYLLHFVSF